jgi:hypothetical protein
MMKEGVFASSHRSTQLLGRRLEEPSILHSWVFGMSFNNNGKQTVANLWTTSEDDAK